jgi:hypothetical protein
MCEFLLRSEIAPSEVVRMTTSRVLYIIALCVLLGAVGVSLKFVQIPVSVTGPCYVSAALEWRLSTPEPGKMAAELISRRPPSGRRQVRLYQFAREDFVSYESEPDVCGGKTVQEGQIVGRIRSVDNESLLRETIAQVDEAAATLALLRAGSKAEILEHARWMAVRAYKNSSAVTAELDRKERLFEHGLVSLEELELARSMCELAQVDVRIAEAELSVAEAGEQQEAQQAALHVLESLRSRAEGLREKVSWLEIRAPFTGVVTARTDTSEVLSILKTDSMAVEVPVRETDIHLVKVGQEFMMRVESLPSERFHGDIRAIGYSARRIAGEDRIIVTGLVENTDSSLRHGVSGLVEIKCGQYPLLEYMSRQVSRGFERLR